MRRIFILYIICVSLLLCGCGHTSKGELLDVTKFRCQENIENVYKVLGEHEQKNESGKLICEYNNVNAWGYESDLIFKIRDDKKTIASFSGTMKLNKKESENVLAQLASKFGPYKVETFTSDRIYYIWNLSESDAEAFGYNEVEFIDEGNKTYSYYFRDEWSMMKDEAYYESKKENDIDEHQKEQIYSQVINSGENTVTLSLDLDLATGKKVLNCYGTILGTDKINEYASYFDTRLLAWSFLNNMDYSMILMDSNTAMMCIKTYDAKKNASTFMGTEEDGTMSFTPSWFEDVEYSEEISNIHNEVNSFFDSIDAMK